MDTEQKQQYAQELAEQHMQDFDFLGVVEALDDDGTEYTDDEAEEIHDMILNAQVRVQVY